MKFSNITLTLATAGSLVAAQPHRHHHRHVEKRSPTETEVVTVVAYEFDGKPISSTEVFAGIADKKLAWADGAPAPAAGVTPAPASPAPESSAPAPAPSSAGPDVGAQFFQRPESSSAPYSSAAASSASPASTDASSSSSSSSWSGASSGQGLNQDFPDGEIDCSTFPSKYGAIDVDWLKLGGWTGIQHVTISGGFVTYIETVNPGGKCTDGSMCSYACPAGYQKSQWPSTQGAKGESVGGLSCSGGKLHLTNPSFKQLCIQGAGNVHVQNKLGSNVAICRTDYPGKLISANLHITA